jgi:hypothetical protein
VTLSEVLAVAEGETVRVGTPFVAGAAVVATVLGHGRRDKVTIFKMQRRKHFQKHGGHRQNFTELRMIRFVILLIEVLSRVNAGAGRADDGTRKQADRRTAAIPVQRLGVAFSAVDISAGAISSARGTSSSRHERHRPRPHALLESRRHREVRHQGRAEPPSRQRRRASRPQRQAQCSETPPRSAGFFFRAV